MKPNFFIAGAQKCGTTTLHHYLSQHPDIFCHPEKELHFFDRNKDLKKFLKKFERVQEMMAGESTPIYMNYPFVAERMKEHLGFVGLALFFLFLSASFKNIKGDIVLTSYLVVLCITALFIDIFTTYKAMLLFWVYLGWMHGLRRNSLRSKWRINEECKGLFCRKG